MTRLGARFLTAAAVCLSVGMASHLEAKEPAGVTKMTVSVPAPDEVDGAVAVKTRQELGEKVLGRVEKRLEAAGVDFVSVEHTSAGVLDIRVDGDVSRQLLSGIVLPSGELEIRRVRQVGDLWVDRASDIPEGVRIRQADGSLEGENAYLWSRERRPLASFLEEVEVPRIDVLPFAASDGWRSVALGETLVTNDQVESASIDRHQTGAPFVSIVLNGEGKRKTEAMLGRRDVELAMVVDGEVVALLDRGALAKGRINVSAPSHLAGGDVSSDWARQVAGRVVAPIPVTLVPQSEE